MTTPALVDDAGRSVRLGREIDRGAVGVIYAVDGDPTVVAKTYPPAERTPDTEARLRALLALTSPNLLAVTAWPRRILFDIRSRAVAGFLMENVAAYRKVQELYSPVQRLKSFPRAGWDFQVRAATNLAAAFEEVHAAGVVVGDVSLRNEFVSPQAVVKLLDCDSFQVRAGGRLFTADVGTPLYVPPELIGKPLRGLVRAENHDRFGLAVLIYQLLFVGRHPYAGVYRGREEPEPDFLIANYKFAQGPLAHTWGMTPPPHCPMLADLPPAVGGLFRRAFERGSEAGIRPRPADWVASLGQLERELAACPADPGHKYWKGAAGGCVWCRIARAGGPEYYYGVADGGGRFAVDEARLVEVLRRLAAVPADPFPYTRAAFAPTVRPAPRALPGRLAERRAALAAAVATRLVAADAQQVLEHRERQRIADVERKAVADVTAAFRRREAGLIAEAEAERAAGRLAAQAARATTTALAVAAGVGLLAVGLGCVHRAFAVVGAIVLLAVGVWLTDHLTRSPAAQSRRRLRDLGRQQADARSHADRRTEAALERAEQAVAAASAATRAALRSHDEAVAAAEQAYRRQLATEADARRRAFAAAEASLDAAEQEQADVADRHRRQHAEATRAVHRLAADCRGLAAEHQSELSRLTAGAEAAARVRHLRLHLLADADIPKVGAGRKQALAAAGVFTAADVTVAAILGAKGFGDALTASVLGWRAEVERRFKFDPAAALPPAAGRVAVASSQARQQQHLAELSRLVAETEGLLVAGRGRTQSLAPRLHAAVSGWEQARCDLAVLPSN